MQTPNMTQKINYALKLQQELLDNAIKRGALSEALDHIAALQRLDALASYLWQNRDRLG